MRQAHEMKIHGADQDALIVRILELYLKKAELRLPVLSEFYMS